jgi:hypothetical protein
MEAAEEGKIEEDIDIGDFRDETSGTARSSVSPIKQEAGPSRPVKRIAVEGEVVKIEKSDGDEILNIDEDSQPGLESTSFLQCCVF